MFVSSTWDPGSLNTAIGKILIFSKFPTSYTKTNKDEAIETIRTFFGTIRTILDTEKRVFNPTTMFPIPHNRFQKRPKISRKPTQSYKTVLNISLTTFSAPPSFPTIYKRKFKVFVPTILKILADSLKKTVSIIVRKAILSPIEEIE